MNHYTDHKKGTFLVTMIPCLMLSKGVERKLQVELQVSCVSKAVNIYENNI